MTLRLIHDMKSGDLYPPLEVQLLSGDPETGEPTDLSAATGTTLRMRLADGDVIEHTATIFDAGTGMVRYEWQNGDTDVAGAYRAEFVVQWPTGPQTFPSKGTFIVNIEESLSNPDA